MGCGMSSDVKRLMLNDTTEATLNLWKSYTKDGGVQAIASALECNATLTTLYVSCNGIETEGARFFATVLERNSTLTTLSLECSYIGVGGTRCLATALEHNRTLTALDLWGNNIGDEGLRALATALKHNRALTKLFWWENNIGDEDVCISIERSLCRNRAIQQTWKRRRRALLLWVGIRRICL